MAACNVPPTDSVSMTDAAGGYSPDLHAEQVLDSQPTTNPVSWWSSATTSRIVS